MLSCFPRLFPPQICQFDIDPSGKSVFEIPLALSVAYENKCSGRFLNVGFLTVRHEILSMMGEFRSNPADPEVLSG